MKKLLTAAVLGMGMFGLPFVSPVPEVAPAHASSNPAGQALELQARAWIAQNYRAWTVISSQANARLTAVNVECRFNGRGVPNANFQFQIRNTGRGLELVTPPIRTN